MYVRNKDTHFVVILLIFFFVVVHFDQVITKYFIVNDSNSYLTEMDFGLKKIFV